MAPGSKPLLAGATGKGLVCREVVRKWKCVIFSTHAYAQQSVSLAQKRQKENHWWPTLFRRENATSLMISRSRVMSQSELKRKRPLSPISTFLMPFSSFILPHKSLTIPEEEIFHLHLHLNEQPCNTSWGGAKKVELCEHSPLSARVHASKEIRAKANWKRSGCGIAREEKEEKGANKHTMEGQWIRKIYLYL